MNSQPNVSCESESDNKLTLKNEAEKQLLHSESDENQLSAISKNDELIDDWNTYLQKSQKLFMDKIEMQFKNRNNMRLQDFTRYHKIGEGSYGKVVAVYNYRTKRCYAMKILNKQLIIQKKQVEHTYSEKRVLQAVSFPFLIHLKYFFMDITNLYLVLPLGNRGDLYTNLNLAKSFNEETARFYGGQVILALEYLHFLNVVYRDVKLENIVVCNSGYIKLADFGFCKRLTKGRTYSFCGTPDYMAPELLKNRGYGRGVDWWAFGVLLYEMLVGVNPFESTNQHSSYEKILAAQVRFPVKMNTKARHLIQNLLEPDLSRRYGNLTGGVKDVKEHPWFSGFAWNNLLNQKVQPPHVPSIKVPHIKLSTLKKLSFSEPEYNDNIFKDF